MSRKASRLELYSLVSLGHGIKSAKLHLSPQNRHNEGINKINVPTYKEGIKSELRNYDSFFINLQAALTLYIKRV